VGVFKVEAGFIKSYYRKSGEKKKNRERKKERTELLTESGRGFFRKDVLIPSD